MSVSIILGVKKPSELRRTVIGENIKLEKGNLFVIVPLREWNRYGLEVIV